MENGAYSSEQTEHSSGQIEHDRSYIIGVTVEGTIKRSRTPKLVLKEKNSKVMIVSDCLLRVAPREVHD
jgi:hypothetical protein